MRLQYQSEVPQWREPMLALSLRLLLSRRALLLSSQGKRCHCSRVPAIACFATSAQPAACQRIPKHCLFLGAPAEKLCKSALLLLLPGHPVADAGDWQVIERLVQHEWPDWHALQQGRQLRNPGVLSALPCKGLPAIQPLHQVGIGVTCRVGKDSKLASQRAKLLPRCNITQAHHLSCEW